MNKSHIIIGAISIALMVIVGVVLFSNPELISIGNEVSISSTEKTAWNVIISVFCGASVYAIFYGIPHEYKVVNQKNNTDPK